MTQPKTKKQLLDTSEQTFNKLRALLESMTSEEQQADFDLALFENKTEAHWQRDRNVRDVLVHLYEWHQMLLNWVSKNEQGIETPFLPLPFTWKTYGVLNVQLWEQHQSTPLEESKRLLKQSHKNVMNMIEAFSNETLFTKKHFSWTGTTSLGTYCVSATCSHYNWALKKLNIQHKAFMKLHAA